MKKIKRPLFLVSCKCERCGNNSIHTIREDSRDNSEVYYMSICMICFRNKGDPDYMAEYCKVTKEGWTDFVSSCLN